MTLPPSAADLWFDSAPVAPTPDVPRDQYDRPLIKPPAGVEPKYTSGKYAGHTPYARASSFGGQIEDDTNLVKWQKRQVARGMALRFLAGELFPSRGPESGLPGDPWDEPTTSQEKRDWNKVAEDAEAAVGSYAKAAIGTAIHACTEAVDHGLPLDDFPPEIRERGEAWRRFCKEYGIEPVTIETFGVEDEHRVAGTWDRTARVFRRLSIGDVKTGSTMDFAGIGYAVQLAEYAHMQAYDPVTGDRTPHEGIDLETAWIFHVDRNVGGPVTLHKVDITVGWRYAQVVNEVMQARRDGTKAITGVSHWDAKVMACGTRAELSALMMKHSHEVEPAVFELANRCWETLP
jgi:hypothetical protein